LAKEKLIKFCAGTHPGKWEEDQEAGEPAMMALNISGKEPQAGCMRLLSLKSGNPRLAGQA
jgi:hypothetical protein